MAQTVTIGEQKVCPESESLKLSATPTPQVENPSDSDSTTPTPQPCGFGWTFHSIVNFDIHNEKYKPLRGGSWVPTPKFLANKKLWKHEVSK